MFKLTVLYDTPQDVERFNSHYLGTHVPLARKVPGLARMEVTLFSAGPDGSAPRHHLMAELYFPDGETMAAALATPEGKALGADVQNFADTASTRLLGTVA